MKLDTQGFYPVALQRVEKYKREWENNTGPLRKAADFVIATLLFVVVRLFSLEMRRWVAWEWTEGAIKEEE